MNESFPNGDGSFFVFMDITVALLLVLLLIRELMAFRERSNMLDRLMAKNLPEYKAESQPEENQLEDEKPDDSVPIEEAEEELVKEEDGE